MTVGTEALFRETLDSIERIQYFDVGMLPRESELGKQLNFKEAVEPASVLINLYKLLSAIALQDFRDNILTEIRDNADRHFELFHQIMVFNPQQQDAVSVRGELIISLESACYPAFEALNQSITYSLLSAADFRYLDPGVIATLRALEEKSLKISTKHKADAKAVLDAIRKIAAGEDVTKQDAHDSAERDTMAVLDEIRRMVVKEGGVTNQDAYYNAERDTMAILDEIRKVVVEGGVTKQDAYYDAETDAMAVLDEIRRIAAEGGVSDQDDHFGADVAYPFGK